MPSEGRVAQRQAALVAALASAEPSLEGFDETRLRAVATLLRYKRRRAVAMACPALPRVLGERFTPSFDEYAGATRVGPNDTPIDDAVRFLDWLGKRNGLPRQFRFLRLKLRLRCLVRA